MAEKPQINMPIKPKSESKKASVNFGFKKISLSILTGLIVAGIFCSGVYVFAVYGVDSPYPAGDTLNPSCIPGATNCTVSQWTAAGSDIYYDSGNVGIGTTTPEFNLHIVGTVDPVAMVLDGIGTSASAGIVGRKARGTVSAPEAIRSGDILFTIGGRGYNGTDWGNGFSKARIQLKASEDWTSTANGTQINFGTTINGSLNPNTRMVIANDGKVGIGTTSPASLLDVRGQTLIQETNPKSGINFGVVGDATFAGAVGAWNFGTPYIYLHSDASYSYIDQNSSGMGLQIRSKKTGGTFGTDLVLTEGSVGIGTTNPGSTLDVKGTLRLSGATSGYVGFIPAAAAGSTTYTLPSADGTNGQFLKTNGSGVLSWVTGGSGSSQWTTTGSDIYYNDGNVGIGTATPATQFEVNGSSAGITLDRTGGLEPFIQFKGAGSALGQIRGVVGNGLRFTSGSSVTEWARFDGSGNFGIGTTSPESPLEIVAPVGDTDSSIPAKFVRQTTDPAHRVAALRGIAKTSGNMVDGFGPRIRFEVQDDTAGPSTVASVAGVRDGSDTYGALGFYTGQNGNVLSLWIDANHNVALNASAYLNWGTTLGSTGYGFRDNSGTMEYKNSSGTWAAIGSGGSGMTNPMDAIGELIYGDTGGAAAALSAGLSGQILVSGGAAAPAWSTATYPSTTTANQILFSTATNTVGADSGLTYDSSGSGTFTAGTGTEVFTVLSTGNVGIGNTTPSFPLDIVSTSTPQFAIENVVNTKNATFAVDTDGNMTIVPSGGNVKISGTLTIGASNTAGTLATRVSVAPPTESDSNGSIVVNSGDYPGIYFRYGNTWKYAAEVGGFQIPKYENTDPITGEQIKDNDIVLGMINKVYGDEGLHGIWVKWDSVKAELIKELQAQGISPTTGTTGSVVTIDGVDTTTMAERVGNVLSTLGISIMDGVTNITTLATQKFSTDTATVKGLQMVDKATGDIYCTWIENGEWQKTKGECGSIVTVPVTTETPTPEIPASETPAQPSVEDIVQQVTEQVTQQQNEAVQQAVDQAAREASQQATERIVQQLQQGEIPQLETTTPQATPEISPSAVESSVNAASEAIQNATSGLLNGFWKLIKWITGSTVKTISSLPGIQRATAGLSEAPGAVQSFLTPMQKVFNNIFGK